MFDYKLLEALSAVVNVQGFERAAELLFLTQSAVSQRIKLLEEHSGQILITRQNPPLPTEYGKKLITHYEQVRLLEHELIEEDKQNKSASFSSISIGVNTDSLGTWFLSAVKQFLSENRILVDLNVDDQDETKKMLKNGEVAGCISSSNIPVQGCSVTHLGKMDYLMVCTRSFFSEYFNNTFSIEKIFEIPLVVFNKNDKLHEQYFKKLFDIESRQFPAHYVPSSEQFLRMIEMELAYGVIPLYQFKERKSVSSLMEMTDMRISVDLYWHHWNIKSEIIESLCTAIIESGKKYLSQE